MKLKRRLKDKLYEIVYFYVYRRKYCFVQQHGPRISDGHAHPQSFLRKTSAFPLYVRKTGATLSPYFNEPLTHTPSESSPDNMSLVPALLVTSASSFWSSGAEVIPVRNWHSLAVQKKKRHRNER